MDRNPVEVLKMVISYVDIDEGFECRKALKSLRLTCKRLSAFACPALFRTIPLWLSIDSLQNLSNIAEHPRDL